MPGDVSLGTIAAYLKLQATEFFTGLDRAMARTGEFGAVMNKEFTTIGGHGVSLSNAMLATGGAIAAGLAVSTKAASDFQKKLSEIGGNTTLTSAQLKQLGIDAKKMSTQTGAAAEDIADAFMHASNLSFSFADSQHIVRAALESALSSGAKVADVTRTLAQVMREGNIPASKAAEMMDALHLASANSTVKLEEFAHSGAKAFGMAGNLGVNLKDAAAVLAVLTKHGFPSASLAATQFTGLLSKIVNPAAGTRKELERLSKLTGIDLVGDFSAAGLKAKGLPAILDDMARATKGDAGEIFKLIPATRGGLGALALLGTGAKDLQTTLVAVHSATGSVATAFERQQKSADAQTKILQANLHVLAIDVGTTLLPALNSLVQTVTHAVEWFNNLSPTTKRIITDVAAFTAGSLLLGGALGKVAGAIKGFRELVTVVKELGAVLKLGQVLSTVGGWLTKLGQLGSWLARGWEFLAGAWETVVAGLATASEVGAGVVVAITPIGWAVAAITAVVGVLALAWHNNWFHIRDVAAEVWGWLKREGAATWDWIKNSTLTVWTNITNLVGAAWDTIKKLMSDAEAEILKLITSWGQALWDAGVAAIKTFVAGIESMALAPYNSVKDMLSRVAALLPHSDADEGPLSTLTASGEALPTTLADGVTAGAHHLTDAVGGMLLDVHNQIAGWTQDQAGTIGDGLTQALGKKGSPGGGGTLGGLTQPNEHRPAAQIAADNAAFQKQWNALVAGGAMVGGPTDPNLVAAVKALNDPADYLGITPGGGGGQNFQIAGRSARQAGQPDATNPNGAIVLNVNIDNFHNNTTQNVDQLGSQLATRVKQQLLVRR